MSKQREVSIKVPQLHNDGTEIPSEVVKKLETLMLSWFGGFTRRSVQGAWVNDMGKRFDDYLWEYDLACGQYNGDKHVDDWLRALAHIVKVDCAQESVYVRLWDGSVQFV